MKRNLITTVDNPYHPIDEIDEWMAFDLEHGYRTLERLGRVAPVVSGWSDAEQQRVINKAIDDFVRLSPELYKKIVIEE